MLDSKLQLKPGTTVAIVNRPHALAIKAKNAPSGSADAVLIFVKEKREVLKHIKVLQVAGKRGAMLWLAYPKNKQQGTDLNRDVLREMLAEHDLDAVRQISIDDTWSAMRFKYIGSA